MMRAEWREGMTRAEWRRRWHYARRAARFGPVGSPAAEARRYELQAAAGAMALLARDLRGVSHRTRRAACLMGRLYGIPGERGRPPAGPVGRLP